ncbi:MAG TPA: DMT family transporter [Acidimicrobiia bacterium]|jgi:drug/metabolite transporter (DMT)-like permease
MAILFGLMAAVFSGSGDFLGGLASRHGRIVAIAIASHLAGIVATFAIAPFVGGNPTAVDLGWGAAAGVCGAIGIVALYTGFSRSDIAIVSPIAAVGAAGFPVAYAFISGDRPGTLTTAGLLVGMGGIWLISRGRSTTKGTHAGVGVAYGVAAGLGFGWLLVFLGLTSQDAGIWPLAPARAAGGVFLVFVALVLRRDLVPSRPAVAPLVGAGAATIVGNGAFILATQTGSLAVASVLAAMFPAATVVLARLVMSERLTRTRLAGLGLALIAIGMVAAG